MISYLFLVALELSKMGWILSVWLLLDYC